MVTKDKKNTAKKGRVRVGKLKLNKETVKDLTPSEQRRIRGEGSVWGTRNHCECIHTTTCQRLN